MKKRIYFLMMVLVSLLILGCDGNFGIKTLYCTYFVINDVLENSELKLFCKSEKIGISSLIECEDVSKNEKIVTWAKQNKFIANESFRLFYIPSIPDIEDRNNINIYFQAKTNDELYEGNLFIKSLQEDSNCYLFKEPVTLKTEDNKKLDAIFGYEFWRTI